MAGGNNTNGAAGACILENFKEEIVGSFVLYLGGATNNEAEISGGLLGFALLSKLAKSSDKVKWVCDSEYVLKSATQYIHAWQKNGWKTAAKKPVKESRTLASIPRSFDGAKS